MVVVNVGGGEDTLAMTLAFWLGCTRNACGFVTSNSLLLPARVLHEQEAVVDVIPGGRCVIASELRATGLHE